MVKINRLRKLILKDNEGSIQHSETKQANERTSNDNEKECDQTQREETINYMHVKNQFNDCVDIVERQIMNDECENIIVLYFPSLVDKKELETDVLHPLQSGNEHQIKKRLETLPFSVCNSNSEAVNAILNGCAVVYCQNTLSHVDIAGPENRAISPSETESAISGSHDSFIECSETNLSLLRRRVKSSHLKVIKLSVGEISKTTVYLIYLADITNIDLVMMLKERIKAIEVDEVIDCNKLIQVIDEFPNSPFPQFYTTERPDVAASKLFSGKIIGIFDGSPFVFSAPTVFFDFLQSTDDYNQRWVVGTSIRILRIFALIITLTFTALYVSVMTFHYEMIPESLLPSIIQSRSEVPFPPILEALIMEFTIELLREAGARLPTKIGQTIGIVGGIVIGQASVQAGITSNILIIAVAVSAIASFVIPSYNFSGSIRLVRFGFISYPFNNTYEFKYTLFCTNISN
jgi:spore germination protein